MLSKFWEWLDDTWDDAVTNIIDGGFFSVIVILLGLAGLWFVVDKHLKWLLVGLFYPLQLLVVYGLVIVSYRTQIEGEASDVYELKSFLSGFLYCAVYTGGYTLLAVCACCVLGDLEWSQMLNSNVGPIPLCIVSMIASLKGRFSQRISDRGPNKKFP